LHSINSQATTFLLTHEASTENEAQREVELRDLLQSDDAALVVAPICVVAKSRLDGEELESAVAAGLRIAIKRAGLRRSIHEVLVRAQREVKSAFEASMKAMLEIPPEQLDEYVVGRAVAEGVSELHVVERALTANMSESLRRFFATDVLTLQSATRLRSLQGLELDVLPKIPHRELAEFRKKELWEPSELVNSSLAALACGDVFEFDPDEGETEEKMFILLVQPCDVMLRPRKGRDTEAGFFIPLKVKGVERKGLPDRLKQPTLPFMLKNKEWLCDFRSATSVRLDILDLATLRTDGKVRYEKDQILPTTLLLGQVKNGESLHRKLKTILNARSQQKKGNQPWYDPRCSLTLATSGPFAKISHGTYVPASGAGPSLATATNGARPQTINVLPIAKPTETKAAPSEGAIPLNVPAKALSSISTGEPAKEVKVASIAGSVLPPSVDRITWYIRRFGRVRMPYASSLLNSYLSVMGREAFDLDYLKPSEESCAAQCLTKEAPDPLTLITETIVVG
jgi:hypothetical protein